MWLLKICKSKKFTIFVFMNIDYNKLWKQNGIYCIMNTVNGNKYIGSSKNLYNRLHTHLCRLRKGNNHNKHLQNSFNKHKEENFDYFILEFCKNSEIVEKEQYWIDFLKPKYNKRKDATTSLGLPMTDDAKKKLSKTLKKNWKEGKYTHHRAKDKWRKVSFIDIKENIRLDFPCIVDFKNYIHNPKLTLQHQYLIHNRYLLIRNLEEADILGHIVYGHKTYYTILFNKKSFYLSLENSNNEILYFKTIQEICNFLQCGRNFINRLPFNKERKTKDNKFILRKHTDYIKIKCNKVIEKEFKTKL